MGMTQRMDTIQQHCESMTWKYICCLLSLILLCRRKQCWTLSAFLQVLGRTSDVLHQARHQEGNIKSAEQPALPFACHKTNKFSQDNPAAQRLHCQSRRLLKRPQLKESLNNFKLVVLLHTSLRFCNNSRSPQPSTQKVSVDSDARLRWWHSKWINSIYIANVRHEKTSNVR